MENFSHRRKFEGVFVFFIFVPLAMDFGTTLATCTLLPDVQSVFQEKGGGAGLGSESHTCREFKEGRDRCGYEPPGTTGGLREVEGGVILRVNPELVNNTTRPCHPVMSVYVRYSYIVDVVEKYD